MEYGTYWIRYNKDKRIKTLYNDEEIELYNGAYLICSIDCGNNGTGYQCTLGVDGMLLATIHEDDFDIVSEDLENFLQYKEDENKEE